MGSIMVGPHEVVSDGNSVVPSGQQVSVVRQGGIGLDVDGPPESELEADPVSLPLDPILAGSPEVV